MAVTRAYPYWSTGRPRGSRYKVGSRTRMVNRKKGKFGVYRSTKFTGIRTAARAFGRARIPRYLNPFPNTKLVRHKYVDTITIPAAGGPGVLQYWQFRANSMYDPDFSGVGHQPMFRDEMAAQYTYYTVLRSNIQVVVPPEQTTKMNYLLYVDDDSSVTGSVNTLLEQHRFYAGVKADKRNFPLTLKAWFDAAKWTKSTQKALMADNEQKVGVGSNPPTSAVKYYVFAVTPVDPGETVPAFKIMVTMTFLTVWREPVDHVGS